MRDSGPRPRASTLGTTEETIHVSLSMFFIRSSRYGRPVEDLVGDAIRALRIGDARSARAYLYDRWSLRWDPSRGAGFNIHVVLEGAPWLRPDGREPMRLDRGDVVFVSRVIAHGVSDSSDTPLRDVPIDEDDFWFANRADPDAASEAPRTVLIGGSYYLDREHMHPLLEALPPVIVLPRSRRNGSIDAIVELLGAEHDHPGAGTTAAIPALLDLLLAYVIRAGLEADDSGSGWSAAVRDRADDEGALEHAEPSRDRLDRRDPGSRIEPVARGLRPSLHRAHRPATAALPDEMADEPRQAAPHRIRPADRRHRPPRRLQL